MALFGHKKKTDSTLMMLSVRWRVSVSVQMTIGPWPKHEVVLMAVRKAVSAATRTFTANSMMRCFFIVFVFFRGMRLLGGAVARGTASLRLEARDYSVAG